MKTMGKECPHIDPDSDILELYGSDLYCSFTKVNAAIGHATSTITTDGKDVECQVACQRQENEVSLSYQEYPGENFSKTREFWRVVYQLYWSCNHENYQYKRLRMDVSYPELCPFFDEYFFSNDDARSKFEEAPKDFLDWAEEALRFSKLEEDFGMNLTHQEKFTEAVMNYSKDNLARVMFYIQRPFISIFIRDQALSYLQLVANMGGLLGLCMGFSVVSVAEIIYHLVVIPLYKMCCKPTNNKTAPRISQ